MTIRIETPAEFAAIYNFIKTAFSTAAHTDGDEQNFADRLRASGNYLPELALVAEVEGQIVGHIMLTCFSAISADGDPAAILLVAPLAVALECRSQGVGSALMREALRRAKELGYKAALLVGDPAYYARFGYRISTEFGIRNTDDIADEYVQAVELEEGALKGFRGVVTFANL